MSRTSHSRLLTVVFLQFIFLASLASPLAQGTNPYGDLDKMDSALEEALASNEDDSILHEVIFQLKSPVTSDDLQFMKTTGAIHLHDALLIDGGLFEAPSDTIRKISLWDRIEYLELNRELDFFYLPSEWGGPTDPGIMMHETTHVVGATDAWHRVIVDTDVRLLLKRT